MKAIKKESRSEFAASPASDAAIQPGEIEHLVIHPLDDAPERKLTAAGGTGRMKLTPTVKASLFALRAYLILMLSFVAYRVLTMAASH